ncbi:MAG TPA: BatD family protein [Stenotrophomonas sp.]|jgi:hypothetical protein
MAGLLLWLVASASPAATRAWLDRDRVAAGEPVTLNIETDQRSAGPDYSALGADFGISGQQSSRQMEMTQGTVTVRSLFAVVLTPRRSGSLTVPALQVGADSTAPLALTVTAATAAATGSGAGGATGSGPMQARGDQSVFVETRVDDTQPYVQQSVGVVVRLYYATQLAAGALELEAPEGASLQQVGDDANTVQTVNGRAYNVAERRYLLVPERSGSLVLPGAKFTGRAVGGFFDDYFGRGNGELNAHSASTPLQVRAQPDNAPQPWLPLRDLRLRYTATPQRAAAGETAQIVVEATAVGATRAQFPDLVLPPVADAQVFPEPAQFDERFVGGSPQLKWTRRFSLVPNRAGKLVVPGIRLDWWDVRASTVRSATLPDLTLDVAPGTGAFAAAPAPAPTAAPSRQALSIPAAGNPTLIQRSATWATLAAVFALLWLFTLVTAVILWRRRPPSAAAGQAEPPAHRASASVSMAELRRAIDNGGLDEVGALLCAMGGVPDLDAVVARLADPAQRQAVQGMQRARWAGEGDIGQARQRLREAFREGPRWQAVPVVRSDAELPPLYPER